MSRQCFLDFGNSRVKAWLCVDNVVLGKISHEHRLDVLSFFTELPDLFQQKISILVYILDSIDIVKFRLLVIEI